MARDARAPYPKHVDPSPSSVCDLILVHDSPAVAREFESRANRLGNVMVRSEHTTSTVGAPTVQHALLDRAALDGTGLDGRALERSTAAHAVVVEVPPALVAYLPKLLASCHDWGVALIGLTARGLDEETQAAFASVCHALVEIEDDSAFRQIAQHIRWHARLANPEDPTRRRVDVSQRHLDRRVKHLRPYADFFRNAPEAMIVADEAGMILYTNPAARRLAGAAATEGPRSVFDYLGAVEADRARALANLLSASSHTGPTDFQINTVKGTRVVSVHAGKMQRSPGAFLLTFRDVTDQRELERALTHTRDFLQQVIDSSVDAIVSADLQGNILVFNRAAGRIFDHDPTDVVGKLNVRKLYPPGGAESTMRLIRSRERSAGGQLEGHQTQMLDRRGNVVPVRLSAAFVREGRSIVATVGVFTDIRHELELAEKLRRAEAELHETEKGVALAQLAGMTAHELNQPLTIILGYSELLQRVCTQPDAQQAASVLANQAQRLAEIVRRIGRITRYETKGYVGGSAILDLERATRDGTKT